MNPTLPGIDLSIDALTADAIALLQKHVPVDLPYWGCFSGGKDSCVIKHLAILAGIPVEWHYNVTTIDPPELVHFIRRVHPDVFFDRPTENFFTVAKRKGFPTRRTRWCCSVFKETRTPRGRKIILGVRAAESAARARRWKTVTLHKQTRVVALCPIVRWQDADIWVFIRAHHLPYCSLYDEGWDRLGCIGCPMSRASGKTRAFSRWPGFERKWKELFRYQWEQKANTKQRNGREWFGSARFNSWQEMWEWWLNDQPLPNEKCEDGYGLFT